MSVGLKTVSSQSKISHPSLAERDSSSLRRALLVYNPRSGSHNPAALEVFLRALEGWGWSVERCELSALERVADTLEHNRLDRIIVSGGDGTVGAVACLTRVSGLPLMIFPGGTGNLVFQNLKLPRHPLELAEVCHRGYWECFDWVDLSSAAGQSGFLLMAGAGFDADLIRESEALKASLGVMGYLLAGLKQLSPQHAELSLELDGVTVRTRGIMVLIANFGRANLGLPILKGIDPQDGLLHVMVLKGRSPLTFLPHIFDSILGKFGFEPLFEDRLEIYTCRQLRLETHPPLYTQLDGDAFGGQTPFSARVVSGAVRLVCPEPSGEARNP